MLRWDTTRKESVSLCVSGLVFLSLRGPKIPLIPHKDSKTWRILRTKAILSLGVRVSVRIRVSGYGKGLGKIGY